jgi:hypothetical protein
VAFGVVEKIGQDAGEQASVAGHGRGFVGCGDGETQVIGHVTAGDIIADQVSYVDLLGQESSRVGGVRVEPGQEQQVGGDVLELQGVVQGVTGGVEPVGGPGRGERKFKFGAQAGERGTQFVGDVGGELPLPGGRRIEAVQDAVHRRHQLLELPAATRRRYALVETAQAQGGELRPDVVHRFQGPADDQPCPAGCQHRESQRAASQPPHGGVQPLLVRPGVGVGTGVLPSQPQGRPVGLNQLRGRRIARVGPRPQGQAFAVDQGEPVAPAGVLVERGFDV